ncbi:MAG: nucleotide exchange factor GrpE [Firmicutes bacterium HGW-Firmicutes-14]|jgi:molecular chaperone GrpE|nr:MAG: nucleotide exchange factor GrpE [Firmicutes bacterium HGW-Firmicutes-14]
MLKESINEETVKAAQEENGPAAGAGEDGAGDIQEEIRKYEARAEEYLQLLQRVQADFDNYRRRSVQEREEAARYCSMRLAGNLLPVLDNFERALKSSGDDVKQLREGVELIYRQFKDTLEKEGVRSMEAVGSEFDPNLHEAVMQEPSEEHDDNTVIEEFQKGYMLADRVIRPAMVKVAKKI